MKPYSKMTRAELIDLLMKEPQLIAGIPRAKLLDLVKLGRGIGPIEEQVRKRVKELDSPDPIVAALAVDIASRLDAGVGMALAGVSKELREVLEQLDPPTGDKSDDDGRAAFRAAMSAAMGDPAHN